MNAKQAILHTIRSSDNIVKGYLGDLDDADLLVRPVEGMNPIAWQIGHLIASERMMVESVKPGSCPVLDAAFLSLHERDAVKPKPQTGWLTKAEYMKLWDAQRAATLSVLEAMTDAELDAPGPERMKQMAPTMGTLMNMTGLHVLMHAGQFVSVRRQLHKPIAM